MQLYSNYDYVHAYKSQSNVRGLFFDSKFLLFLLKSEIQSIFLDYVDLRRADEIYIHHAKLMSSAQAYACFNLST